MDALGGIRYGAEISAAAAAHGLDPKLLAAVAAQETGGPGSDSGANIVGDAGHGHGLFQIDDRTWAFASTPAAMDPAANANEAAGILQDDLHRFGDVRSALSAYNAGSPTATGTQTTWGDGRTLGYADSVLRHYAALGGDPEQLAADTRAQAGGVNALAALSATQPGGPGAAAPPAVGPITELTGGGATAAAGAGAGGTGGTAQTGGAASAITSPYANLPPPAVQPTSQSPFAPPISWANEMSANGPAGGKEAADADSLVASLVDSGDGAFDDQQSDA